MNNTQTSPLWNTTEIGVAMQLFEENLSAQNPAGQGSLTSKHLCSSFAEFCRETFDCIAVTVWSLDPLNNHLVLMGSAGVTRPDLNPPIIDCLVELSGWAVERKRITAMREIGAPDAQGREFLHRGIIEHLGARTMVSVPILDTSNVNQPLLMVNLFPQAHHGLPIDEEGELPVHGGLHLLAEAFATIYEMYLRDRGIRLASRLNLRLAKVPKEEPSQRCLQVTQLIREALECDSVILYLEEPSRRELVVKATSGMSLGGDMERILRKCEAHEVWAANRERLIHGLRQRLAIEDRALRRALHENEWFCSLVPFRDLDGRAQGTILCVNRCPVKDSTQWRPFTYEDIAIIEAISEAFAPHLAVILADEQRNDALSKVAHEVRVPVVALHAALERIEMECRDNGWAFRYPYFREVRNYTLLMSLLLKNLDTIRKSAHLIPLEPASTRLLSAIIAPAKRFLAPLLRQRGFGEQQIHYSGFEALPVLHVDTLLMMQVFFNLLENAIKYYRGPVDRFRIEMDAEQNAHTIQITFRDWGIGVPPLMREDIFKAGVRADNAIRSREPGDGLGLWLAREVVRRHGGDLIVKSCAQPTEFVIQLPARLELTPPPKTYEQDSVG